MQIKNKMILMELHRLEVSGVGNWLQSGSVGVEENGQDGPCLVFFAGN